MNLYGFVGNDALNRWDFIGLAVSTVQIQVNVWIEDIRGTGKMDKFLGRVFNTGVKLSHTVTLTLSDCKIIEPAPYVGETIEYDSAGSIKGRATAGSGGISAKSKMVKHKDPSTGKDECYCWVEIDDEVANPLVGGAPNIDVEANVTIKQDGTWGAWDIAHDGFPSYNLIINSEVHSYSHSSAGTTPWALGGGLDVTSGGTISF